MSKQPLIMNILDILKKYSDENHRLSQKDIIDLMEKEYDIEVDRKSVKRNIKKLIEECGYDIRYEKKERKISAKNKSQIDDDYEKDNSVWYDFYIVREFENEELKLLIDSLIFSRHIPYNHCKRLIEKLEALSSIHFKSWSKYISNVPRDKVDNQQVFFNIKSICEAIDKNRKISFIYMEYGTDKKMHAKKCEDGTDREYIISPYKLAAKDGKYYLICNHDEYEDISNYRIDRIKELNILDATARPFNSLKGSNGYELDLEAYMKEHVYMYSSDNARARLRINRPMISDVIDMFGSDITFSDEDEKNDSVTVCVYANEIAIMQFAKSFAPDVELLTPIRLRNKMKEELRKTIDKYNK